MKCARVFLPLMLICPSIIHPMDTPSTTASVNLEIQVHSNETSSLVTWGIPVDLWKRFVYLSSCKNVWRLVSKFFYPIASRNNRKVIIKHPPLYLHTVDLTKMVFECVENDECAEAFHVLDYMRQAGWQSDPMKIINFNTPLWYYAPSEPMKKILENFGTRPNEGVVACDIGLFLVRAARSGDLALCKKELDKITALLQAHAPGSRVHQELQDIIERAACHACEKDHAACLELLIPYIQDLVGTLFGATVHGSTACVECLLRTKVDVNATVSSTNPLLGGGYTQLMTACKNGKTYIARLLLDRGADQKMINTAGMSALSHAMLNKHSEIIELLIEKLPDTQENRDWINANTLFVACLEGNVKTVHNGLDKGYSFAPLRFSENPSPLHIAASAGQAAVIPTIIAHGYHVDQLDSQGRTPLFIAVSRNQLAVVQALHVAGADLNFVAKADNFAYTNACGYAVRNGHVAILQYLVQHGAHLRRASSDGGTLLHLATETKQNGPIIKFLLEKGLSKEARYNYHCEDDGSGYTPLDMACKLGNLSAIKELVAAGASLEQINYRKPPMVWVCTSGKKKAIQFCIEEYKRHHTSLNDALFNEMMEAAIKEGHLDTVQLLVNAGVSITDNMIRMAYAYMREIGQLLQKVQDERQNNS